MRTLILFPVLFATACGPLVVVDEHTESWPVTTQRGLVLDHGAGNATVRGAADAASIDLEATVRCDAPGLDPDLDLRFSDGYPAELRIITGNPRCSVDVTVDVPSSFALEVHDASGNLLLTGLASLLVDDGSGNLEAGNIDGPVELVDDSGNIDLYSVRGDVYIADNSGNIGVTDVVGDVTIVDGSGNITVLDVTGLVTITDGSGNITVADYGDVRILEDSSGDVSLD